MFAPMDRLTDGLWYERQTASTSVVAVRRRTRDPAEPVLRIRRGAMNGRRVHVDLVLLGGDRTVEVSFHPAATVDLVRGHAERAGGDANGWMGSLLRAIVEDARTWGSWSPSGAAPAPAALAVLGGVTHPLLGAAYDLGVAPAGEIPRWASAALAESSMAAAALRLFGPSAPSRAVVRSLGALLLRPAVAWWHLAVASAISSVCGLDDVAAVLVATGSDAESDARPSAEDLAVFRAGFALLEPARARRLALDALAVGGARRLEAALRALVDARDELRWPPPARLAELEAACLRATAVDPTPPSRATPRPVRPLVPEPARRPAPPPVPSWATARRAPATSSAAPAGDRALRHRPEVRALEGDDLAGGLDLELVLPRTPDELRAWGRMLGNCLGDFGAAVAEGRSVIVGVRQRGALVAAVELVPNLREIRQFLGVRNRVPPDTVVAAVLARFASVPATR